MFPGYWEIRVLIHTHKLILGSHSLGLAQCLDCMLYHGIMQQRRASGREIWSPYSIGYQQKFTSTFYYKMKLCLIAFGVLKISPTPSPYAKHTSRTEQANKETIHDVMLFKNILLYF